MLRSRVNRVVGKWNWLVRSNHTTATVSLTTRQVQHLQFAVHQLKTGGSLSGSSFKSWHHYTSRCSHLHTSTGLRGKVVPFNLPDVGEAIQTVEVKEWMVKVGDHVNIGDEVCEVQSDKSAVTVYVPYDGVITQLMYEVGDVATKGKPLLMVEVDGEDVQAPPTQEAPPTAQAQEAPPTTQAPPTTASSMGDVLAAPAVRKIANEHSIDLHQVKGTGKDGRILKEDVMNYMESRPKVSDVLGRSEGVTGTERVLATPAVRRIASEKGINLSEVRGTGEDGRVLKDDLLQHVEAMKAPPPPPPVVAAAVASSGEDRTEPIKGFKAVMVRTMTASGQVPQFGYCDEVNMSRLVSLRSSLKNQLLERGVKFSYMPIIIKAVSVALRDYPMLNATVNDECTAITHKADHNIGVAMDTPEGLVVPIVKQVQNKSVYEIAVELNRLHEIGLKGHLAPSDIVGGTFSLSNIGAVGGTYARPMLLPPQVAIGAFGKVRVLPRYDASGAVFPAHVMEASWSADHRVVDGATVARFSNAWKELLEEPSNMLLELR